MLNVNQKAAPLPATSQADLCWRPHQAARNLLTGEEAVLFFYDLR